MDHPCLCDICLRARDAEIARVRAAIPDDAEGRKIVHELRKLEKQGEDYIWRPAKRAADYIERHIGRTG